MTIPQATALYLSRTTKPIQIINKIAAWRSCLTCKRNAHLLGMNVHAAIVFARRYGLKSKLVNKLRRCHKNLQKPSVEIAPKCATIES